MPKPIKVITKTKSRKILKLSMMGYSFLLSQYAVTKNNTDILVPRMIWNKLRPFGDIILPIMKPVYVSFTRSYKSLEISSLCFLVILLQDNSNFINTRQYKKEYIKILDNVLKVR